MVLDVLKEQFPEEYDLLVLLAQGKSDDYKSVAPIFLVNHLEGYGLVEKQIRGPIISVRAVKEYLLASHRYELVFDSDEQRREEIGARSNALEIALRELIRRALRATNSESKAREILLRSLSRERREKLDSLDYKNLIGNDNCPLFLLELKSIIDKSWDPVFKNLFPVEKSRLMNYFDDINEARRAPAHAKSVSAEDFTVWRSVMRKFEAWIDDTK